MSPLEAPFHLPSPVPTVERVGLQLHSAFQPILSVVHKRVVGHEALIRAVDERNEALCPGQIFPRLTAVHSAGEVNELFSRLHLQTFAGQNNGGWLFLNFSPDSMPNRRKVGDLYGAWLSEHGVPPNRVVVEIIETRALDEGLLEDAVAGFRDLGCLVAIDDFGAGESNFERIWRLRPDIVKLDRAMIIEAAENPVVARILPGLVSLIHEAGCLVVMEGIETARQAQLAVESNSDFVQGYWFARPDQHCSQDPTIRDLFDRLADTIQLSEAQRHEMDRSFFSSFSAGLDACVAALEVGVDLVDACQMFLALAGVQRVYELDDAGYQLGENLEAARAPAQDDRFAPCADARGANFCRRPYFRRAMEAPGRVQVSRPYLSIRDARTCVTMSIAYEVDGKQRVLCTDLDYDHASPPSPRLIHESGVHRR